MKNDYCVIGIGRFGTEIVNQLINLKMKVLAIDSKKEALERVDEIATHTVLIDHTDINALKEAGVHEMNNVIVAIGSDIEESILTCANLVEFKIPNIIAKASNINHAKILKAIGVNNVILPDIEAAKRTAYRSVLNISFDVINLNKKYFMATTIIKNSKIIDIELQKLNLKKDHVLNICYIKRDNDIIIPHANEILKINDEVTYIGETKHIKAIDFYLSKNY